MKKVFVFLISIVFLLNMLSAASTEFKIDYDIFSPSISSQDWTGDKVPGGREYTITSFAPNTTLYYGVFTQEEYQSIGSRVSYLADGEKWDLNWLRNWNSTTDSTVKVQVKNEGVSYVFAVSVNNKKSSTFVTKYVNVDAATVGSLRFQNGNLSGSKSGDWYDLYASLNPDMSDAVFIKDGPVPAEFLNKDVYFQVRNYVGWADSEATLISVPGIDVPAPKYDYKDVLGGVEVTIKKPVIEIGQRVNFSDPVPSVDENLINVYYTTDGSTPIVGESELYTGPFILDKEGSYPINAVAEYNGNVSTKPAEDASGSWWGSGSIIVEQTPEPTITVSGLDISLKTNSSNDSMYFGFSPDSIDTKMTSNFMIIDESMVGSTIYFQSRGYGNAPSSAIAFEIKDLQSFQEQYSTNGDRCFGNWMVKADLNSRGVATGTYSLYGRFPSGSKSSYEIVVAGLSKEDSSKIDTLVFCSLSSGDVNSTGFTFNSPWSITYEINGEKKGVDSEVYHLDMYNYKATYYIPYTVNDENDKALLNAINTDGFNGILTMNEGMSMLDGLAIMQEASYYANPDAAAEAIFDSIELGEKSFVFSTEGLKEAISYINSLTKK